VNRKQAAESLRGRQEVRRVPAHGLEVRELNGAPNLTGWASVTETAYQVGAFQETIRRGAFAKSLSERPDVVLLVGHEGLPLARTTSGSLRLNEDDRGLHVDATLEPEDPDVQRLLPKVRRGDVTEMSFAFRVVRQSWNDDYDQRTIHEVNIDRGDVSVVTMGANPATSFSMRDAKEFLEALQRPEFDELVRQLERDRPGKRSRERELEIYKARAFALRLHGERR
jgi:HK97 family phage prohead protease